MTNRNQQLFERAQRHIREHPEADRVAVESRGNFEFADGRVYRNSYHHLFELPDGHVVAIREYLDLRVFEEVFGPIAAASA